MLRNSTWVFLPLLISAQVDETLKRYGINIDSVEDLDKILDEITGDTPYKLVDVEDDGDKVEIYIE